MENVINVGGPVAHQLGPSETTLPPGTAQDPNLEGHALGVTDRAQPVENVTKPRKQRQPKKAKARK
jgi:hypothetical protein